MASITSTNGLTIHNTSGGYEGSITAGTLTLHQGLFNGTITTTAPTGAFTANLNGDLTINGMLTVAGNTTFTGNGHVGGVGLFRSNDSGIPFGDHSAVFLLGFWSTVNPQMNPPSVDNCKSGILSATAFLSKNGKLFWLFSL